jgi:calcineurin-like phosphoesterase family protein
MRLICISDTHSLHKRMLYNVVDFINPNEDNVLIHAGDCTNVGRENEVNDFIEWFKNIEGFKYKIFIAGNHDFSFENEPRWINRYIDPTNLSGSNVTYLEDSLMSIIIDGFSRPLKIYGSPWQPEFYNWAFNLPRYGEVLKSRWDDIPDDTDILITHGPPHGIRDFIGERMVGCELLRERVNTLKPLLHIFGHIHESYGPAFINDIAFVNASICDERYAPINKPLVFDLIEENGIFTVNIVEN